MSERYPYLHELADAYCREDNEPCDHCLDRARWDMDAAFERGFQMVPIVNATLMEPGA